MQVSWIDPDEIARLAAQIEGPLQRDEPMRWDSDVMPDFSALVALEEPSAIDSAHLADAIAAPVPEPLDQRGAAPAPELEHIREKLRAIRSRAEHAGLLPPEKLRLARPEMPADLERAEVTPEVASGPASEHVAPAHAAVPLPPLRPPEPAANSTTAPSAPSSPLLPPAGSLTERLRAFMQWAQSVAPCEEILLVDDHGDLLWGARARADLALSVVLAAGAGLRTGSDALAHSSVFIRSPLDERGEMNVLPCPTRHGMVALALLNPACLTNETVARLRDALTLCVEGSRIAGAVSGSAEPSSPMTTSPGPLRPRPPIR